MEIFIDTGIFCAAANSRDPNNEDVKNPLKSLEKRGGVFYTSDYVLDETCTLIRSRVSHSAAVKFIEKFNGSNIMIKRVSEEIEDYAKKIFIKYEDKDFSFTDCTSFAIIDMHGIKSILSLDKDFKHFKYKHSPEFLI